MPTQLLFREDAYLTQTKATVEAVNERGGIILDRTVLYATGGGQPGDSGRLIRADGSEIIDEPKLLPFLRTFAVHARAGGLEAAAHWHDEQAARYRDLAAHAQEPSWIAGASKDDLGKVLSFVQEQVCRHEHDATMIRSLAAGQEPPR